MRIFTFWNTAEDAPASQRAIARIWCEMTGRGGKSVQDWHPVIVYAPTEEAARAKAQAWWDAEVEKAAKVDRRKGPRKAPEAAPAPVAAPEVDLVEEAV